MSDIQWVAGLTLFRGWQLLKCFGIGLGFLGFFLVALGFLCVGTDGKKKTHI